MTNKAQQKICCIVVGAVIIEHCCLFFFWFWCIPNLYHSCKWDFIRPHTYKDNGNKSSFIKHKILQANEDIGKYTQRICAEDIGIDFILSTFWWDFKIKKDSFKKRFVWFVLFYRLHTYTDYMRALLFIRFIIFTNIRYAQNSISYLFTFTAFIR